MKIDNSIQEFMEKYDRDAITSIDAISKNFGLNQNKLLIEAFDMNKAFDSFIEYTRGYSEFCEKCVEDPKQKKSIDVLTESFRKFIDTEVIKESKLMYKDLPGFVFGYIEGVKRLINNVEEIKENMLISDVDQNEIGAINEYTDMFIDKINEKMDVVMDKILWASGYNSKKALTNTNQKKAAVFV